MYVSGTCSDGESGQGDKGEEGVGWGDDINLFVVGVVFVGIEKYKINGWVTCDFGVREKNNTRDSTWSPTVVLTWPDDA